MLFRYYDRPIEMYKEVLDIHEKSGDYFFQFKEDGWLTHCFRDKTRSLIKSWGGDPALGYGVDGSLFFVSRRGMKKGGPTGIPVSKEIVDAVEQLELPDQTMLASEWMKRRTSLDECPEKLFVFDVMYLDNKWQGDLPLITRSEKLINLIRNKETSSFEYLRFQTRGFLSTFEMIAKTPSFSHTEGVVMKHVNSYIKGNSKDGVDNGLIIKVKWRSGQGGRTIVL